MIDSSEITRFEEGSNPALKRVQQILHVYPILIPFIVLFLSVTVFGFVAGERFFSAFNLSLIMQQVSIIGILAAAQTLIILSAGIDLSIAAMMVLVSVLMGKVAVNLGIPDLLAVIIGIAAAVLAGLLNGFMVTRIKLPPFIVTLGTWNVFYALNLWLSGAQSIQGHVLDEEAPLLKIFGQFFSLGNAQISYGSVLMLLIFVALWFLLNKTAFGRHIYAVGDDKDAANLAGVKSDIVLRRVYMLAGAIAALAAWASIGRVGSISPQSFYEANLQSITAVVIGGISLFGGRGNILGALIGALIVGVFQSGLRIAGVDVLWQVFAIGWLIILAVALDQWIRRLTQ